LIAFIGFRSGLQDILRVLCVFEDVINKSSSKPAFVGFPNVPSHGSLDLLVFKPVVHLDFGVFHFLPFDFFPCGKVAVRSLEIN